MVRETLTINVSVMDRALRLDEVGFECYRGEADFPAVVLTDYAEVTTERGQVGAKAGDFVVDGPDGIEVLDAVGFSQKYSYEKAGAVTEGPEVGFVQDLDVVSEDPATADKGVTVPGDTPGDQVPGFVDRGGTFRPDDEGDGTEVGEEDEAPSDGLEPDEPSTEIPPVSQFEALEDNELWDIANSLEIAAKPGITRSALVALIDAAVTEAENAPETTD